MNDQSWEIMNFASGSLARKIDSVSYWQNDLAGMLVLGILIMLCVAIYIEVKRSERENEIT